jgi:hypothetical protein
MEATPVPGSKRLLKGSVGLLLLSVLLFVLGRAFPLCLEQVYGGVFPVVAAAQAGLLSMVPLSVSELSILLLLLLCLRWLSRGLRPLLSGLAWLIPLLLASGILLWGLNHCRPPIAQRLGWSMEQPLQAELAGLIGELSGELKALEGSFEELELAPSTDALEQLLTSTFDRQAKQWSWLRGADARLRVPLARGLLARLGIAGVYSPWTGEAHLEGSLPGPIIWHTAAHEVAHQRGIAREEEANFIAWVVLRDAPEAAARYSARFALLNQALGALGRQNAELAGELRQTLHPALQERRTLVRQFWRLRQGALSRATGRVNDSYLKAAGQEQGLRSYGLVLDLVLAERR